MRHDRGDESFEVNSLSPAGQVKQVGDLALGWRTNHNGRRRAGRMLLGLVAVLVVSAALVLVFT
jgi:hypothetical protein